MARRPATTLTSSLVGELGGPDVDVGLERWGSDHRAVASTFEVEPAPAPALVGTDRRVVRRGDTLTIRYASHRGRLSGILPRAAAGRSRRCRSTTHPITRPVSSVRPG
jgi:hypothetical protein